MPITTTYSFNALTTTASISQATGLQRGVAVVSTGGGNSVAFWYDSAVGEIAARTISQTNVMGTRVVASSGSVFVSTSAAGTDEPVSAARLNNGNIVLTWASNEPTKNIYFRIFDANLNPLTPATLADSYGVPVVRPDVAALAGGGFVIVAEAQFSATDSDVIYRRYDAAGTALDAANVALSGSLDLDQAPSVAGLNDGGFAIGFTRTDTATTNSAMWHAVHNADGTQRMAAQLLDSTGVINRDVEVVARTDGGYSMFYEDSGWTSLATNTEITAANLNASGGFQSYTRGTAFADNNFTPTAAVSPEGFIIFEANQFISASDTNLIGGMVASTGSPLLGSAVFFGAGINHGRATGITWLDGRRFRVTWDQDTGSSGDSDQSVNTQLFEAVRTSNGDAANDTANFSTSAMGNIMNGGDGDDTLVGGSADDTINGGNNNDTLIGNGGDDVLTTGAGSNHIVSGGDGNDIIDATGSTNNELIGGLGNDIFIVSERISSTVELAGEGNDEVRTTLSVYALQNNIEGLVAIDNATHSALIGNASDNQIIGGTGVDDLFGREGNDALRGGTGSANTMLGQQGDDIYYADAAGDSVIEFAGEGFDTVYTSRTSFTLRDHVEALIFSSNAGAIGIGGDATDNLLWGNVGDDQLNGRGGNDLLIGGAGNNILQGGAGNDTFRYISGLTGLDRILDFTSGQDQISLQGFTHTAVIGFVQNGAPTPFDPVSTFLHNVNNGIISYDPDGTGPLAAIQLAQLNAGLTLAAGDFVFV